MQFKNVFTLNFFTGSKSILSVHKQTIYLSENTIILLMISPSTKWDMILENSMFNVER